MVLLKSILPYSAYSTIGSINNDYDLELLERYIINNKPFIEKFPYKIISQNGIKVLDSHNIWNKHISNCVFLDESINRGHTFGTLDLDNNIFKYSLKHKHKIKWVWKLSNDVIISNNIFNKKVNVADFYYFNNIGYNALPQWGWDLEKLAQDMIDQKDPYPQTNFFIIKNNIDYFVDIDFVNNTYQLWLKNQNKKPWELQKNFSSESLLNECTTRNKLSKYQLLDKTSLLKLLNLIKDNQIADGSYKNILFEELGNFCHFQYPDHLVYII